MSIDDQATTPSAAPDPFGAAPRPAGRGLAGIREEIPLAQAGAYHAAAREAALDAFGRAYEAAGATAADVPGADTRAGADSGDGDGGGDAPEYVIAATADDALLVIAGAWPAAGRTCGRLVAPRALLALLLDDPTLTAVWCDEDDGEGLALTAYAITLGATPMLLVVAR